MPGLNFVGKDKVTNYHQQISFRFLEKKYGSSENMIIHGDNLLALRSLLAEYRNRIKCIYIDPPYNTGNEGWIYNDNVNDPEIRSWIGKVVGDEETDLNRHDKWLCMMYPRLRLLHELLSEDGAIFISIDDNEVASLKLICDEIFGRQNLMGVLTWEATTQPTNSGRAKFGLQKKIEPILCYRMNAQDNVFELDQAEDQKQYPHQGKFGKCRFEVIETSDAGSFGRPTMKFQILGQTPREGRRWKIGEETARRLEANGRLEIVDGVVKKAVYPEDESDKIKYIPFWSHFRSDEVGTAQTGKEILNSIMGKAIGFDTVKPPKLLKEIIKHLPKDSIVLDAFAGSGTTAQAVIELNREDGGSRKFILIESMDYAESITAERVRRVGGEFSFYELGEPIFIEDEINPDLSKDQLRRYLFFSETKKAIPIQDPEEPTLLGISNGIAYHFFDSILDLESIRQIKTRADSYIIYGASCNIDQEDLDRFRIVFRKISRDVRRL